MWTTYFVKIMTELSQSGPRLGDNACTGEHLRVEMHHTQTLEVRGKDLPEPVEAYSLGDQLPAGTLLSRDSYHTDPPTRSLSR